MGQRKNNIVSSILALAILTFASSAFGQQLPPASHKPAPTGASYDYGSWYCLVEASNGFYFRCSDGSVKSTEEFDRPIAAFYGVFVRVGRQFRDFGSGITDVVCGDEVEGASQFSIDAIYYGSDLVDAMKAFWPLNIGNEARFTLKHGAYREESIDVTLRVARAVNIKIANNSLDVYVVTESGVFNYCRVLSISGESPARYERTWWYDPAQGVIVKSSFAWKDGRSSVGAPSFELKSAHVPTTAPETPKAAVSPRVGRPIARDTSPPKISAPSIVSAKGQIAEIRGRVRDDAKVVSVMVDGKEVGLKPDGTFSFRRGIPRRKSSIQIEALDEWGNRATHQVSVIHDAPKINDEPLSAAAVSVDPVSEISFGEYHALVVGNNDYGRLPRLATAVNDAEAVATLLRRAYGFRVQLLLNATRNDIFAALSKLRANLSESDNLLIYYAGHGILDDVAGQGFWLPVNAEIGLQTNWVSNWDITTMIRAIRAKHVMVVADSCYAGTLVRSTPFRIKTKTARLAWLKRMVRKRSRTALVSGGLEPVEDSAPGAPSRHSVFAKAFLTALRENKDILDGNGLFEAIKRPVVVNADQTPQYADIRRAGHDGGDFLFVRR